uniref:Uncharacterized protein n=1 Tax=Kalanchoe fedtschenkoi TaxID=63787 RepID=A0A7N0ULD5_KALFE
MGDDSPRFVPFSWENKPGVSKVKVAADCTDEEGVGAQCHFVALKLPPPPCPHDNHKSLMKMLHLGGEPLHVPLPPGAFDQRPARSLSKRGFKVEDDPFLLAYKECTKTSQTQRERTKPASKQSSSSSAVRSLLGYFSCRASSRSVRDTARIPPPQPRLQLSDTDKS